MDTLIKRFAFKSDDDLNVCEDRGIAYQADMSQRVDYHGDYFGHCDAKYTDHEMNDRINSARCEFVARHYVGPMVDVGIGNGSFIKHRGHDTFGFDTDEAAIAWLGERGLFQQNFREIEAFSFWDVIEHIDMPENYFGKMKRGALLFTSIPIFENIHKVKRSIHYRPGEHFYYFTHKGFIDWMELWGFRFLASDDFETRCGRADIGSYAFCKDLPDYGNTVGQYQAIHESRFYGDSAGLYFDMIAPHVLALDPSSILDYGCGRSDMAAHFWNDGRREIHKYDPAIGAYKMLPKHRIDLVICCDVMEHILMRDVERVFGEIRNKSDNVIFTISTKLARTKLPDGRNAHVTILTPDEWLRWILEFFGTAIMLDSGYEHILLVKTWV